MIDFSKGVKDDGKHQHYNKDGIWYAIVPDTSDEIKNEVASYLAEHPEALVPEPEPPEPIAEQKAMVKAAKDEAKEWELDKAWLRAQRKKG